MDVTASPDALTLVAAQFSPRYEHVRDHCFVVDIAGLRRLFGDAREIGEAIHHTAAAHQLSVGVAIAATQTAAQLLAHATDRLTVIGPGQEPQALASLPLDLLGRVPLGGNPDDHARLAATCRAWGLRTLGDVARLPAADLRARLGPTGLVWQQWARGEDARPLIPTLAEERFAGDLELDWPIEGLEPLSFILTRVLEPISVQLERRDRGAARVHLGLRLVTKDTYWRHLELPAPMRDVRTLRTLLLLDVESHPPTAAIDHVSVVVDPTPARVVQHTLFTRPQPAPEQVSTLLARLGALMGTDRIGSPAITERDQPGAFRMTPFRTAWHESTDAVASVAATTPVTSTWRCYRSPIPVRVTLAPTGEPVRIAADRAGCEGGVVRVSAGPWTTSGAWWESDHWDIDEWDVSLTSGTIYRLARHRKTSQWLIHAVAD